MRRLILLLMALILPLAILPLPAQAQEAITVLNNEYEDVFAQEIVFRLSVESQSEVEEIILFYRVRDEAATNRAYPEIEPGLSVETEWTWELEPGDIAVGSEIKYYWKVKNKAGDELKTEPVIFIYEDTRFEWQSLSEDKLTLYWYGEEQEFGQHLLDVAMQALKRLQEEVGVALEDPVKIYVYLSKSDMSKAISSRSESFDAQIITLGMAIGKHTMLLLGSASGVEQTIAHELSHIVVHLATDNPLGGIPAWLDEGLAMYAEGELPPHNAIPLEDAIHRDELISVRSLSSYTGDPEQVDLYYGEVHSLVSFMLKEYGKEKMSQLLAIFKEGSHQEDALREVYGFGLDELDDQWRAYLGLPPRYGPAVAPSPGEGVQSQETPGQAEPSPSGQREGSGQTPCCFAGAAGLFLAVLFFLFKPGGAASP